MRRVLLTSQSKLGTWAHSTSSSIIPKKHSYQQSSTTMLSSANLSSGANKSTSSLQTGSVRKFSRIRSKMRLNCSSLEIQMNVTSIPTIASFHRQAHGTSFQRTRILGLDTSLRASRSTSARTSKWLLARPIACLTGLSKWAASRSLSI